MGRRSKKENAAKAVTVIIMLAGMTLIFQLKEKRTSSKEILILLLRLDCGLFYSHNTVCISAQT